MQRHAARHTLAATVTVLLALTGPGVQAQTAPATTPTSKTKPAAKTPAKAAKAPSKAPAKAKTSPSKSAAGDKAKAGAAASAASAPATTPDAQTTQAGARQADYIIALVNSEPITNNELRARMARAHAQLAERNMRPPSDEELRKQVLEVFISERAQLQLAKEMNIEVDQLTLKQAEESVAQQNNLPSVDALHQALRREGVVPEDFRNDLRRQISLQRLRDRMIEPRVKVSEADIDRFLREQMAQQGVQAQPEVNLAMILVRVPEGSSPAEVAKLRERAEDVAKRAKTEDFAKLASEFSQSTNQGKDGGELGLRGVDKYPALFISATSRLPVGGVTEVVRSDAGFHVLKVVERKKGPTPTITVPQTHVRHILYTIKPGQSEKDENLALQRLRDFKRRVEAGQADFAQLARENSQDASAQDGGDLGWANPGQFVPEFEQVMNGLAPGQVSEPLRSRFGLHLIQVLERRQQALSEADQRGIARNMLRERKAAEEFENWSKEVRGRAFVEMRDEPH